MSCPTGTEIKAYINFLKAYSKHYENNDTNNVLRKGIKAWQRLPEERKHEFESKDCEPEPSELTTNKCLLSIEHYYRIFSKALYNYRYGIVLISVWLIVWTRLFKRK